MRGLFSTVFPFWLAVIVVLADSMGAAQTIPAGDALRTIQRLLQAVYPDLMGTAHASVVQDVPFSADWSLSSPDQSIAVRVAPRGFHRPSNDSVETSDDEYLKGVFTVRDEFIENAYIVGRRVRSREINALLAKAGTHPEWRTEDLDKAIIAIGGKYPSTAGDTFAATLPMDALRDAFGVTRVRKQELTFEWRQGVEPAAGSDVPMPRWILRLNVDDSRGRRICYVLFFEPIDGNLAGLIGNRCDGR